jgi:sulfur relay (sulfurtransferase) DsrC/TusE family protein
MTVAYTLFVNKLEMGFMSELKSWGFEKAKTKTHLIAFRLDDEHWNMLQDLFTVFDVQPRKDNMTERMVLLIHRTDDLVEKVKTLEREKISLESKVRRSEKERDRLIQDAGKMVQVNRMQPKAETVSQPSKSELPVTRVSEQKTTVVKEEPKAILEKHGLVETKTPVCARGHKFLSEQECDACSYHTYCNYSTANKHFISHDAT